MKAEIEQHTKFSEADPMGVIWHGTYLRYFEDGREAFGRQHGLSYLDFYSQGFYVPIVKSEIDHKGMVQYGEEIRISITLIPCKAAKIVFEYEVYNLTQGYIAATGKTVQVFMNAESKELFLNIPDFYKTWLQSNKVLA
jgi:acyl-CoA thioester hydrolase